MTTGRVAALWIYPVKAGRGLALEEAELGPFGLGLDRRWMIVRTDGRALTQREEPRLARLVPSLEAGRLRLDLDGTELAVPLEEEGEPVEVVIWGDRVRALAPDPAADRALSQALRRPVRIVRLPEAGLRPCDPTYAPAGSRTAFTDGFPILVTSEASLSAVNAAIRASGAAPVPMTRFRPNLVLEGVPAWAEDRAHVLSFDRGAALRLVKPCARCIVTTTDQATGERLGPEPIRSLQALGRDLIGEGPCFGWNAVPILPDGAIRLRVGRDVVLRP